MENKEQKHFPGDGTEKTVHEDTELGKNALLKEEIDTNKIISKEKQNLVDQKIKDSLQNVENDIYRLNHSEKEEIEKKLQDLKKEADGYGFDIEDTRSLVLANTKTESDEERREIMNLIQEWEKLKKKQQENIATVKLKEELLKYYN